MKRYVLDCSVSVAWILEDEASSAADRFLDLLADGEAVVPTLWIVEMANALVVAERRRRINRSDVTEALELLSELPITVHAEPRSMMVGLCELAREHDLSAYDACYIDLARRLRLPLASLDRRQTAAANAASVELL